MAKPARSQRNQSLLQFLLLLGVAFSLNIIAGAFYTHIDLTEEKRYTLTRPTKELLRGVKDRIYVQVLLEGKFPAGFKRLQTATRDMLTDFRSENAYVDFRFEDPSAGTVEEVNSRRKALASDGIVPTNLRIAEQGETTQKLVYPVAVVHFGNRRMPVRLLENESPSLSPEQVINNSISLLEYKFADVIKKLRSPERPIILFTDGHGELDRLQTGDLERTLRQFYDMDRVLLDSMVHIDPQSCALLIVAKPRFAFSERDKFKIDQYVMNGGKVMWLIDRLGADLDSLRGSTRFVPSDYPLNLEDILFKYGARIQPDLVLDLECSRIPLQVGQLGNAPQFDLFKWYYHPTVMPGGKHPIVKNLDRVELRFCSSIDTVRTKTPIQKTPLLLSSKYSRLQFSPIDLNFDILKYDPIPEKFDKGNQMVGVLLEGIFPSNYENRVSADMLTGLQQLGLTYKTPSVPTRMLVISDGDVAANFVRSKENKEWLPLGFNRFEGFTYANKELMLNAIEYLMDANGIIEARNREVKLRLLDPVRTKSEKTLWQAINIAIPLGFLGIFSALFAWYRKRRYAKPEQL